LVGDFTTDFRMARMQLALSESVPFILAQEIAPNMSDFRIGTAFVTVCAVTCDGLSFRKLLIINTCDGVTAQNPCARQGRAGPKGKSRKNLIFEQEAAELTEQKPRRPLWPPLPPVPLPLVDFQPVGAFRIRSQSV
jgi:hypothetical protein